MSDAPPPSVLIIEDERPMRQFLSALLKARDYRVIECQTGRDGLLQVRAHTPDVVIVDLGLPDMDGIAVCSELREWTSTPIIVVSARGMEEDKVLALDAGADDYLTKPFSSRELLARLRVAFRHLALRDSHGEGTVVENGRLRVDLGKRRVFVCDQPVELTPTEYDVLRVLVRNVGKVVTHATILQEVWGPDSVEENHYVRVYMGHLRRKLEADPTSPEFLITEPGVGYRLRMH